MSLMIQISQISQVGYELKHEFFELHDSYDRLICFINCVNYILM
jgi:hypothetical protein